VGGRQPEQPRSRNSWILLAFVRGSVGEVHGTAGDPVHATAHTRVDRLDSASRAVGNFNVNLLMAWAGAQAAWSIALDYDFAPYAGRHWSGWSELAAIGGAMLGMVAHAGLGML